MAKLNKLKLKAHITTGAVFKKVKTLIDPAVWVQFERRLRDNDESVLEDLKQIIDVFKRESISIDDLYFCNRHPHQLLKLLALSVTPSLRPDFHFQKEIDLRSRMIDMLFEAGANPNIMLSDGQPGDKELFWVLFSDVARSGHVAMIHKFIKAGANVNASDQSGLTALHTVAITSAVENVTEVMDILIHHGADLNAKTQGGVTVIELARLCKVTRAINHLEGIDLAHKERKELEEAIAPKVKNSAKESPLRISSKSSKSSQAL